jgi:membrane protease subunit (stomatin/prohibitin family)
MLASASPRLVEQLDATDERQTAKVIFKDQDFFNVERLSYSICSELEPIGTEAINKRVGIIIHELKNGTNYTMKVVSLIAERLFESMISRGFKSEHIQLAYFIGEEILKMLDKDNQAIRRLRSVHKLFNGA